MTANSNYAYPCQPIQVTGVVNVQYAEPHTGATLLPLGVATDSIQITERHYYHDIPGDANGGQQGPPIDIQKLGEVHTINIRFSSWHYGNMQALEQHFHATRGEITQGEIGTLMFQSGSAIRLLLETAVEEDVRNYWHCILREPKTFSIGTKYTEQSLTFEAHRVPCHQTSEGETGVIYDKQVT
jgi:hypothetical protein